MKKKTSTCLKTIERGRHKLGGRIRRELWLRDSWNEAFKVGVLKGREEQRCLQENISRGLEAGCV